MRSRMLSNLADRLPLRGLDRERSAEHVGVSFTKFDEMHIDECIGSPKQIDGRIVSDRRPLTKDFTGSPDTRAANETGVKGKRPR